MRSWWVGVAAFLLTACAGMQQSSDADPMLGPPLESFAADGRMSLRQGQRSDHLQFDWRHGPGSDLVLFSSLLGQGVAELGRNAGGAWLRVPGEAERRASDFGALAQEVFGAALPLDALAEWLRGAQPAARGEVDGWHVTVTESVSHGERRLPRRLEASRDDVELRIVIDSWGNGD